MAIELVMDPIILTKTYVSISNTNVS